MADHRPNRYEEDGKVIYRASSLGSCVKSLVALGLGMTPADHPDWLLEKFQQGIDGEPVVIDMLRENWKMVDETDHQYAWHDGQVYVEMPVGTRVVIRGHADGIGVCYKSPVYDSEYVTGDKRLIEVKCCSEDYARVVLRELPPMYEVQVSVYGHYFNLPVMLAVGVKDKAGKVVNVVTKMIDDLPMTLAQVKARVMFIESCVEKGELPDCSYRQWPCQFPWLCDEKDDGVEGTKDEDLLRVLEESIVMVNERRGAKSGSQ